MCPVKRIKVISKYKLCRFFAITTSILLISNAACGESYTPETKVIKHKEEVKQTITYEYNNNLIKEKSNKLNVLPTAEVIKNNEKWYEKVKGTDRWNNKILKVSKKKRLNPLLAKTIMGVESGGNMNATNTTNKDGSIDHSAYQVNSKHGNKFNYTRMYKDSDYAIECGLDVIKEKYEYAERLHMKPTVYNTLLLYNGYSKQGRKYATEAMKLYVALGGNETDKVITEYIYNNNIK